MKTQVYQLDCLTNLHVGDGDASYRIIDKQVQRDVVLEVPTIHSSGIKGSLRYYAQQNGCSPAQLREIFGDESGRGKLKFFAANMITRPLRISCGEGGYVNATCPMIIENEWAFLKAMGVINEETLELPEVAPGTIIVNEVLGGNIEVEEIKVQPPSQPYPMLTKLAGERWALLNDDDFKAFNLPVQARNKLDNGISKNLWYEEVVPHKSRFYIVIMEEIGDSELSLLESTIKDKVVQFGGNSSIGYGYCKVTKVTHYE